MREIKFRGKRIDNGEWVYGSLLQSEIDVNKSSVKCQIHQRFAQDFSIAIYDVIPESVGQYTGLKDKNGKEIYEGDIIMVYEGHPSMLKTKFKVVFIEGAFGIQMLNSDVREHFASFAIYADQCSENGLEGDISLYVRVIGNIHENPELLS